MNKKICTLTGILIVLFSMQSLAAVKSAKKTKATKAKTEKQVLVKMSMDNWFGLSADKLRQQVRGTKDVFITENGQQVLTGLEKRETWFGMSGNALYSLPYGELSTIVITYNNAYYNTVVQNIEKQLKTPPVSNGISSGYETISEAVFKTGKLQYEVKEYLDYVQVEITHN